MPAPPRAAVIGLGGAACITLAVFLIATVVISSYRSAIEERARRRASFSDLADAAWSDGLRDGRCVTASQVPLLDRNAAAVSGEYAAWDGQRIPWHQQPPKLLAVVHCERPRPEGIRVEEFDADGTLADVAGDSGSVGHPVVFTDRTVWLLRDSTPLVAIRPFVRRTTLITQDRDEWLGPFRLRR